MKKKANKIEITTIIDASITFILEGEPDDNPDLVKIAETLRDQLGADNVVVRGVKSFVRN